MNYSFKGFFYQTFIDPLLKGNQDSVCKHIGSADRVIDIACGTGSLSLAIARNAAWVTGIDLSEEIISTAKRTAARRNVKNVTFEYRDASDLSCYSDGEFEVAVSSMAIHQFNSDLAIKILTEMKRISSKIIIADYAFPMKSGFSRRLAFGIERLAGGEHHRNFKVYMRNGGLPFFLKESGLRLKAFTNRGNGVFVIAICD